jgi:hypothetical protein
MEVLFVVRLSERRRILGLNASKEQLQAEGPAQPALEVPELEEEKKAAKKPRAAAADSNVQGLEMLLAGAIPKVVLKHAVAELKGDGTPPALILCMSVCPHSCAVLAGHHELIAPVACSSILETNTKAAIPRLPSCRRRGMSTNQAAHVFVWMNASALTDTRAVCCWRSRLCAVAVRHGSRHTCGIFARRHVRDSARGA